jgi:hypothetical protein
MELRPPGSILLAAVDPEVIPANAEITSNIYGMFHNLMEWEHVS